MSVLEKERRPRFLAVLCYLSFFTIIMNVYTSIDGFVTGPPSEDELENEIALLDESISDIRAQGMDGLGDILETFKNFTRDVNENYTSAMVVTLVVCLVGFAGVLMMWKGNKKGFHIYIIYSLLAIIGMYVYASPQNVPTFTIIGSALVSGLFILLYSRNLNWMK